MHLLLSVFFYAILRGTIYGGIIKWIRLAIATHNKLLGHYPSPNESVMLEQIKDVVHSISFGFMYVCIQMWAKYAFFAFFVSAPSNNFILSM